jgi:hypothetical protein
MHEIDIVWRLGLAPLLSAAIGVEREMRQKTAGLQTYTLVGVGSAVFMMVSIFGFADAVGPRVDHCGRGMGHGRGWDGLRRGPADHCDRDHTRLLRRRVHLPGAGKPPASFA